MGVSNATSGLERLLEQVERYVRSAIPDDIGSPDGTVDGSFVWVRGHRLELTPQLAKLFGLVLKTTGGLPFDGARRHFQTWQSFTASEIRARVAALNAKLAKATEQTPFTIIVGTQSELLITPEFIAKPETTEKLSPR